MQRQAKWNAAHAGRPSRKMSASLFCLRLIFNKSNHANFTWARLHCIFSTECSTFLFVSIANLLFPHAQRCNNDKIGDEWTPRLLKKNVPVIRPCGNRCIANFTENRVESLSLLFIVSTLMQEGVNLQFCSYFTVFHGKNILFHSRYTSCTPNEIHGRPSPSLYRRSIFKLKCIIQKSEGDLLL